MQLGNKNRKRDQKEKQLCEMKLDFFFFLNAWVSIARLKVGKIKRQSHKSKSTGVYFEKWI